MFTIKDFVWMTGWAWLTTSTTDNFPGFEVYKPFCLRTYMRKLVLMCSGMVKLTFSKIKNFEGAEEFGGFAFIPWNVDSNLWTCIRNINTMEETCRSTQCGFKQTSGFFFSYTVLLGFFPSFQFFPLAWAALLLCGFNFRPLKWNATGGTKPVP